MKVALTGRPGIGKTTAVKRVVSLLGEKAKGFWTEEIRVNGRRWGFKVVRTDGEEELLASVEADSPYRVGRYGVLVDRFETFAVPFLIEAIDEGKVVVVDEVGKMELLSKAFQQAVSRLVEEEVTALVTIPIKDVHPLVSLIRRRFKVIHLTLTNRDRVPAEVIKLLEGRDGEERGEQEL